VGYHQARSSGRPEPGPGIASRQSGAWFSLSGIADWQALDKKILNMIFFSKRGKSYENE
jgi:hypothetical protein